MKSEATSTDSSLFPMEAPAQSPSTGSRILAALDGRIEPVRKSPMYFLGLLLVAGLMLLLPLVYVALIAGVGYAVVWHAMNDAYLTENIHDVRFIILIYVAPMIVGVVVMLFMIKPLFNRQRTLGKPLTLSRGDEPLIHAYVDQLCKILGAPHPKRIDIDCNVNAAASFSGAGGLFTGDVVLTIGLPLAAGLDLRHFTGVLAHELGHFAQGSGMRLTYIIRRTNGWFARVVHERDGWDRALRRASGRGHYVIRLTCNMCRLLIWITRRALWCLMRVGSAASALMQRQMEYDADRYEARVAGSDAVEETFARLPTLSVAYQASMAELAGAWRERRLADDLPLLVCQREAGLDAKLRASLMAQQASAKTKLFDAHPCDRDRIASARRDNSPGIFRLEGPATVLFKDFRGLSHDATVIFYRRTLGNAVRPEHLHTTEAMADRRAEQRESWNAQQRYFQGLLAPLLPLCVFEQLQLPQTPDELAALIFQSRTQLAESKTRAAEANRRFMESIVTMDRVLAVRALRAAEIRVDPKTFGFATATDEELMAAETKAGIDREKAGEILREILTPQARRLGAALALAAGPRAEKAAPEDEGEGAYDVIEVVAASPSARLMDGLRALWECKTPCERLRQRLGQLTALLKVTKPEGNKRPLLVELLAVSKKAAGELAAVHAILRRAPYPYEHTERGATISRYCCANLPAAERIGDVHTAAKATVEGVFGLYLRMMADLAQMAEAAEEGIGLPPLEQTA